MKVTADKAPSAEVQEVKARREGAALTARERRERLEAQSGPAIEPIEIDGETWYIKLLDWPGYVLAGIMLGRDAHARMVAGDKDLVESLTVVALHCGVVSGPDATNPQHLLPYFSQAEAHAWAKSPAMMLLAGQLSNAVMARNPHLYPSPDPNSAGATTAGRSSSPAKKPRKSRTASAA